MGAIVTTAKVTINILAIKAFLFNIFLAVFAFWIAYIKAIAIDELDLLYLYIKVFLIFYLWKL